MPPVVRIIAPSRLHFGLWSLGGDGTRRFGGVGAMVQQPALRLLAIETPAVSGVALGSDITHSFWMRSRLS